MFKLAVAVVVTPFWSGTGGGGGGGGVLLVVVCGGDVSTRVKW